MYISWQYKGGGGVTVSVVKSCIGHQGEGVEGVSPSHGGIFYLFFILGY